MAHLDCGWTWSDGEPAAFFWEPMSRQQCREIARSSLNPGPVWMKDPYGRFCCYTCVVYDVDSGLRLYGHGELRALIRPIRPCLVLKIHASHMPILGFVRPCCRKSVLMRTNLISQQTHAKILRYHVSTFSIGCVCFQVPGSLYLLGGDCSYLGCRRQEEHHCGVPEAEHARPFGWHEPCHLVTKHRADLCHRSSAE